MAPPRTVFNRHISIYLSFINLFSHNLMLNADFVVKQVLQVMLISSDRNCHHKKCHIKLSESKIVSVCLLVFFVLLGGFFVYPQQGSVSYIIFQIICYENNYEVFSTSSLSSSKQSNNPFFNLVLVMLKTGAKLPVKSRSSQTECSVLTKIIGRLTME